MNVVLLFNLNLSSAEKGYENQINQSFYFICKALNHIRKTSESARLQRAQHFSAGTRKFKSQTMTTARLISTSATASIALSNQMTKLQRAKVSICIFTRCNKFPKSLQILLPKYCNLQQSLDTIFQIMKQVCLLSLKCLFPRNVYWMVTCCVAFWSKKK